MNLDFKIPEWFTTENAPDDATEALCDAVIKFLQHCDSNSILESARMLIHPLYIAGCNLTYAFVLYQLFVSKDVTFSVLEVPKKNCKFTTGSHNYCTQLNM